MRKIYSLFILLLTVTFAQAQWAEFTGATDISWTEDTNWNFGAPAGVTPPTSIAEPNLNVSFANGPVEVNSTVPYTAKRVRTAPGKTQDFVFTGSDLLTIDVMNATQGNDDNTNTKAIWNSSTIPTALTFNCDVTIANSVAPDPQGGFSIVSATTAGSTIDFGAGNTLTFDSTGNTSFWGAGETNINGTIVGDDSVLIGNSAKVNFGSATSDVSGFTGTLTVAVGSELVLKSNGSSTIVNTKLQANGTGSIITLDTPNVVETAEIRASTKPAQAGRELTVKINANQTLNNAIKMKAPNTILHLEIDPSVTCVQMGPNNINDTNWEPTATVNIINYREGVLKFGTDATSLNNGALLSRITINGTTPGPGDGAALSLDVNGNVVGAENLALSVKDYNAFEFAVYPNPANDVIQVQTQEIINAAEVFDMLGKKVVHSQTIEQINISNLTSGLYMLKLTADNGGVATKKIIKK
ncbi:hypothetical protein KH5_15340 [Urechidicola sp. KH5]